MTVDDADRDGHALGGQRIGRNVAGLHETLACVVQSDVGATDRRRAGAAVGLEDIAVEPNRRLAERPHVGDRTQRPADESLDLLGTTLCAPTLAIDALGDEPGSIEYSAVTQPSPLPFIQRGTSSSTDAVQSTRVSPKVTRHDPMVMVVKSRVKLKGRSSSA